MWSSFEHSASFRIIGFRTFQPSANAADGRLILSSNAHLLQKFWSRVKPTIREITFKIHGFYRDLREMTWQWLKKKKSNTLRKKYDPNEIGGEKKKKIIIIKQSLLLYKNGRRKSHGERAWESALFLIFSSLGDPSRVLNQKFRPHIYIHTYVPARESICKSLSLSLFFPTHGDKEGYDRAARENRRRFFTGEIEWISCCSECIKLEWHRPAARRIKAQLL